MNHEDVIKEHYKKIASLGGKKIAERGPDYMRELQKKGVEARKRRKAAKVIPN